MLLQCGEGHEGSLKLLRILCHHHILGYIDLYK
jgi:hypothetical protein